MYRKGSILEIQFSPERLNDLAGDPFWIDLTEEEARRLYQILQRRFTSDVGAFIAHPPLDTLTLD